MAFVNSLLFGIATLADDTAQITDRIPRLVATNVRTDLSHDTSAVVSHNMKAILIQCQRFGAFAVVRRVTVTSAADFDVDRVNGDAFDLYHELATSWLRWFG